MPYEGHVPFKPKEDRDWATLAHFGGVIGPLPAYLCHRFLGPRGRFTEREAREALEFSGPVFAVVLGLLVLSLIPVVGWVFRLAGVALWGVMALFSLVGAFHASRGRPYRYPVRFPFRR